MTKTIDQVTVRTGAHLFVPVDEDRSMAKCSEWDHKSCGGAGLAYKERNAINVGGTTATGNRNGTSLAIDDGGYTQGV